MNTQDIANQLINTFMHMVLTMHREVDAFTDEQLLSVSESVLAFNDKDVVTGQMAEDVFYNHYQAEWKKRMKVSDEAQDWCGNIDWRILRLPRAVIANAANLIAGVDADKTKAWYQYCTS